MKKTFILLSFFLSAGVLASNEAVRTYVIEQYRSIIEPLFSSGESTQPKFDTFYTAMVEELPFQQRAERSLELAVNRFEGAPDYILKHADTWHGEIESNQRLQTLTTTALNSPLIEIRMAGFELYLAQYDVDKTPEKVDRLIKQFERKPEKNAGGALWAMAAIAARGVDRVKVFDVLIDAIGNNNDKIRRAAVEALARFGGEEIIEPLLFVAQNDTSTYIQERAFCGLAQTGTLQVVERYAALPTLIQLAHDPNSTDQELGWVYQALKEISSFYDVPNDPVAWEERLIDVGMLQLQ